MASSTLINFNYPDTLLKSFHYWDLLLHPKQPTIGSLVLVCKEEVHHYGEISKEAALEQLTIVKEIEQVR